MRNLRQTCAVAILTVALAVSAFAGQIGSPAATSPPPPPSETSTPASSVTTTIILTIISLIR